MYHTINCAYELAPVISHMTWESDCAFERSPSRMELVIPLCIQHASRNIRGTSALKVAVSFDKFNSIHVVTTQKC